jgi:hypothetical protein
VPASSFPTTTFTEHFPLAALLNVSFAWRLKHALDLRNCGLPPVWLEGRHLLEILLGLGFDTWSYACVLQVERREGVAYVRKRLPAWTDRVLVHSNMPPPWQPTCLRYSAALQVRIAPGLLYTIRIASLALFHAQCEPRSAQTL